MGRPDDGSTGALTETAQCVCVCACADGGWLLFYSTEPETRVWEKDGGTHYVKKREAQMSPTHPESGGRKRKRSNGGRR